VTLYEAQECVARINEQAGGAIDIKFGVSINPSLTDSIIVSVIAADFTDEYDFTSVPQYKIPKDPKELGNGVASTQEKEIKTIEDGESKDGKEQEDIASDILPNFLKGKDDSSDGGNQ